MAFGLEYSSPCPFLRRTTEKGQAVTLGIILYAGLTRTARIANDCSCLGYVAYAVWILALLIFKEHHSNSLRSLAHCQELLDTLNVGFVLQCEGEDIIANKKAFDLLKLERGDVAGLKKLLEQQQSPTGRAKPQNWMTLDTTGTPKTEGTVLQESLPDGSLRVEYLSKTLILIDPN